MKILGMMSGTSFDGIDSALCDIKLVDNEIQIKLLNFETQQYSSSLRKEIIAAMPPLNTTMQTVCTLDTLIGKSFAQAASSIIENSKIVPDLIVSHGQTMFHWVDETNRVRGTLQIGEPTWIAEMTGVQVLSNIRTRDVAAGGNGAPLVSILDQMLLPASNDSQGALNLGGISNITITSNKMESIAYDIGPANGLMDAAILAHSQGTVPYDTDGQLAATGKINTNHLAQFLAHPYYKLEAPKSTGKEIFHLPYIVQIVGPVRDWVIQDVLATLLELTVETVAREVQKFNLTTLYVAGGGALNIQMMKRLQERLNDCKIVTTSELGISVQAKEAVAFALIGFLSLHGLQGQISSCTGASGPRLLGSLTPGRTPFHLPDIVPTMPSRVRIVN